MYIEKENNNIFYSLLICFASSKFQGVVQNYYNNTEKKYTFYLNLNIFNRHAIYLQTGKCIYYG